MKKTQNKFEKKILLIGAVDLDKGTNHRFFHIAKYASNIFLIADFISYRNPYGGPPASIFKKIYKTLVNLAQDRKRVYVEGGVRNIVVRKIKLPSLFDQILQGIWIFLNIRKELNKPYDICLFGHPYNFLLAAILKKIGVAKRFIYDDWDYFSGHVYQEGILREWITRWQEKNCIRLAQLVITVTEALADVRREQGAKNLAVIPNGVDTRFFKRRHVGGRIRLNTLIYAGTLSSDWGVDIPIESIPIIKQQIPNIRLLILGSGPDEGKLKALARKLGLDKDVFFLGFIKYRELPDILASGDIGLATYRDKKFVHFASPLKIKEYAAAGLPVITTKIGEAQSIVEQFKIGEVIGHSPSELASVVINLLTDPQKLASYRKNAVFCSDRFNWDFLLRDKLTPILLDGNST